MMHARQAAVQRCCEVCERCTSTDAALLREAPPGCAPICSRACLTDCVLSRLPAPAAMCAGGCCRPLGRRRPCFGGGDAVCVRGLHVRPVLARCETHTERGRGEGKMQEASSCAAVQRPWALMAFHMAGRCTGCWCLHSHFHPPVDAGWQSVVLPVFFLCVLPVDPLPRCHNPPTPDPHTQSATSLRTPPSLPP